MTPTRTDIESTLERFILDEVLEGESHGNGDPLAAGAVDSLGIEQLTAHIEGQFGVRIGDTELTRENFESIARLASLVESKLAGVEL